MPMMAGSKEEARPSSVTRRMKERSSFTQSKSKLCSVDSEE
jgi:hypothetical protein